MTKWIWVCLQAFVTVGVLACPEIVVAQPPGEEFNSDIRLSRQELEAIQQELRYLRERDAQREANHDAIMRRLPAINEGQDSTHAASFRLASDSGADTASVYDKGQPLAAEPGCDCDCGCCSMCLSAPEAPCVDCPRVTTLNPYYNVRVFGNLTTDMLFSESRPVAPGTPYFLAPADVPGRSESTFDLHARQSTLGAALTGPQIGDWQTGGTVVGIFYNDNVLADKYGLLPLQAYGEMRNDAWRFAAGLQFDVFNPLLPTILPFSALSASGNTGNAFRGQVRMERFLVVSDTAQWTLQAALSEPITTSISPTFQISEDNGWPNVEARAALGLGELGTGATPQRPLEIGFSGIVGQVRTTPLPPGDQVVADVWGMGSDFRWRVNEVFGFSAECYAGQGLGTYNGAILQTVNTDAFRAIRSSGGWMEYIPI